MLLTGISLEGWRRLVDEYEASLQRKISIGPSDSPFATDFFIINSPTGIHEQGILGNPGYPFSSGTTTITGSATYSNESLSLSVSVLFTGGREGTVVSYGARVEINQSDYYVQLTRPKTSIAPYPSLVYEEQIEIPSISLDTDPILTITPGAWYKYASIKNELPNKVVVPSAWIMDLRTGKISIRYIDLLP
jgi:hypothetical protein